MAATSAYIAKLASTIQGEGAGPEAQFAIASSMQNRLQAGIDTPSSLLSVGSYEANNHYSAPSPFATQMATAVANGNVGDYGDTGNATYYNGKGGRSYDVYNQGGANIGGNAYSDRYNQVPSNDFRAPSYDPAKAGSASTAADAQQDRDQDQDADSDYADGFGDNPYGGQTPGSTQYIGDNGAAFSPHSFGSIGGGVSNTPTFSQLGGDALDPSSTFKGAGGSGTGTDFGSIGSGNPFGDPGATFTQNNGAGYTPYTDMSGKGVSLDANGGTPDDADGTVNLPEVEVQKAPAVGSGDVGTADDATSSTSEDYTSPGTSVPDTQADSSNSVDAGMDVPSAIDGLAGAITAATNAQDKTAAAASKAASTASANADKNNTALIKQLVGEIGKSTTQSTSTSQDMLSTAKQYTTNLFVRGAIIALGLIFVFVGLTMFRSIQENVVKPVARGAKKAAEIAAV